MGVLCGFCSGCCIHIILRAMPFPSLLGLLLCHCSVELLQSRGKCLPFSCTADLGQGLSHEVLLKRLLLEGLCLQAVSAESGPTLPVIFNLSILLEQQGNQLSHLALQHQVHLNQGPHEVTEHLQWRRDALGKVQVSGGTQLSTQLSK